MGDIKLYIKIVIIAVFTIISGKHAMAATLEVGPSGYEFISILAAIDSSSYGDEVLVYDGIYKENIDFQGKEITVRSEHGASATIIDADGLGNVVIFNHSEGAGSVLDGFTIQNGSASTGGGIYCDRASPTIANCTIHSNMAFEYGGGVLCFHSSSLITNCTIRGNTGSGIS